MKRIFIIVLSIFPVVCHCQESSLKCVIEATLELAQNQTIKQELISYNKEDNDPQLIEDKWDSLDPDSRELSRILNNPAAPFIEDLIRHYSIQGEGFLIGLNGGLVAATNKTSDYYQADEPQFLEAMSLNEGQVWIKKGIPDKSASAILIKIATPVYRRDKSFPYKPMGVLVIGLDEFVMNYYKECK